MKRVLLVGAGNLGRRHLEGLLTCEEVTSIDVVDPVAQALEQAKTVVENGQFQTDIDIQYYSDLRSATASADLAVVATSANERLPLIQKLVNSDSKAILMEKVAFNSLAELEEAATFLESSGTPTWVNCPRRLNPVYVELLAQVSKWNEVHIEVSGTNWGLACNAIHFIDLISFFRGCTDYEIDFRGINAVFHSRRPGYIEFAGRLTGRFADGTSFKLGCLRDQSAAAGIDIVVESADGRLHIDERAGKAKVWTGKAQFEYDCPQPFQSQLTGPTASGILTDGRCGLTKFSESALLHRPFLEGAYQMYSAAYGENGAKRVPIT